jgi:SAM-dependent methyltransferase
MVSDLSDPNVWEVEAEFGRRELESLVLGLPKNASVLEVGCGQGLLLKLISEFRSDLSLAGVEPFGSGFKSLREGRWSPEDSSGVIIYNCDYETFEPEKTFDLIYSVNVVEHLPDWRHFIDKAGGWLNSGGMCVILCPNYAFPYESHFKLPIILNPTLTFKIFREKIENHERIHLSNGLWASLNFVRVKDVIAFCKNKRDYSCVRDDSIIDSIVERLTSDDSFYARHGLYGRAARKLFGLGIHRLFKMFPNLFPYMKVVIRKA